MTITRFDVDLPTDVEDGAYVTYEDHLEELRAETQRRQAAEAVVDEYPYGAHLTEEAMKPLHTPGMLNEEKLTAGMMLFSHVREARWQGIRTKEYPPQWNYLPPSMQRLWEEAAIEIGKYSISPAPAGGWVKCSERMPETYIRVLMSLESGIVSTGHLASGSHGWCPDADGHNTDVVVTHWMPLPAAPKVTE